MFLLLKTYLTERSQFVSFGGYQSICEKIDVGAPQGSVLGPLLFLIHINELQNNTNLKVLNFADDILLYTTFKHMLHRLKVFYMHSAQKLLSCMCRTPNKVVLSRCGPSTVFTMLHQRWLRWIGHARRMEDGKIQKDVLYGKLTAGKCNIRRPSYATEISGNEEVSIDNNRS